MTDLIKLKNDIQKWSLELGFDQMGVSGIEIKDDEEKLIQWLNNNHHGSMKYMEKHGKKRARPYELIPGALRVISFRMTYHFFDKENGKRRIEDSEKAYIANYALGRDYHKTIRSKLKEIISRISEHSNIKEKNYFVDSAPVLERALARNAGLGWIGKNTNLINKNHGSWFFIAEIITDIELDIDQPATNHCGTCRECIDVCPTSAIVAPYELDARKCISYLTIENKESIPKDMRKSIGNRIFGCDDCQIFCPWNKFATKPVIEDFKPRSSFEDSSLKSLFIWTEEDWDEKTKGSAIRRTGYQGWMRNIAVALGNSKKEKDTIDLLKSKKGAVSSMVDEHIDWALEEQLSN